MIERKEIVVNKEIEDFFEKINKIPYGEILLRVLKKFSDEKTWKISNDEKNTKVYGECTLFDKVNPPIIEIVYSNKGTSLSEAIYRNKKDFSNKEHTGGYLNIPTRIISNAIIGDNKLDFKIHRKIREEMDLSNPYKRFLFDIGGFISLSIKEYEAKEADRLPSLTS